MFSVLIWITNKTKIDKIANKKEPVIDRIIDDALQSIERESCNFDEPAVSEKCSVFVFELKKKKLLPQNGVGFL